MSRTSIVPAATPQNGIIDIQAIEARLRPLSSDRLRSTFIESFGRAAICLAEGAVCIKLLEERGESLSGIPKIGTLRRIAAGQVMAELAWAFAESPGRVDILQAPLPDQKRIAKDPVVPVVEPARDGTLTTRMTDLTTAPREIIKQILGPQGIRSPQEQIAYITTASRHTPASRKPTPVREKLTHSVQVRLTESEYQGLVINATRLGLKPGELARRGLVKSNVIEEGKR